MTSAMAKATTSLTEQLGLNAAEIQRRRELSGLTDERLRHLARHEQTLHQAFTRALDAFYPLLQSQPDLAGFVADPQRVARQRAANEIHLRGLTSPVIDAGYVESRLRVGAMHHQMRVMPQAYLCSLAPLLDDAIQELLSSGATEDALTLLDRALFDAALALDAYGMRLDKEMRSGTAEARPEEIANAPSTVGASPTAQPQRMRERLSVGGSDARRRFLELDADRIARLARMRPTAAERLPTVLDEFYRFIRSNPEISKLVPDDAIETLRTQVRTFWLEMFGGDYSLPYAASRKRVGIVHERIGLSPSWYLAGVTRQARGLLGAIVAADPAQAAANASAFLRTLLFDLSFTIDAYMDCRADSVLRTDGYAVRLLATLTTGVAILDEHDRILTVNESMVGLLGVDPGMLHQMPIQAAMPLPELARLLTLLEQNPEERASMLARSAGRHLRLTAFRLSQEGSGTSAIVVDDVTELTRIGARIDVEASEEAALIAAVPDVLWSAELPHWTVLSMSHQARQILGRDQLQLLGRPDRFLAAIHDEDRDRFQQVFSRLAPGDTDELEHRLVRPDGTVIWAHTRANACRGDDDRILLAGATRDVDVLHKERDLRTRSIGQLAGGIAHELNNALTVVFGELQLFQMSPEAKDQADGLERSLNACRRMSRLTRHLLALAQRQVLHPQNLDLVAALRDLEPTVAAQLGSGCTVELVTPDVDCSIRIDRMQFENALVQLAANAGEAMPAGGRLRLVVSPAEDRWVGLEVIDDGVGMPAEVLARATEPFFSTHRGGARGLGLAMVQGFVAQSGGELAIDSAPGKGTRVSLRLPRSGIAAARPRRVGLPRQPTLLIVEDDPDIAFVVSRIASALGLRTISVSSAEQALALLGREPIDAMFSDIALGAGMDGIALADRVREGHPELPILLTSGYAEGLFEGDSTSLRHPFLAKPFTVERLHQVLAELLPAQRDG